MHAFCDFDATFAFHHCDFVLTLQIKPELSAVAEISSEAERCIGGYRPAAVENVGDAPRWHAEIDRKTVGAQISRC